MKNRSLIKNVASIGNATLISRFFGLFRDLLLMRYLGAGVVADAFIAAFRIPNSLRKIFAEGALSAALIPTLVATIKQEGKQEASRSMTIMLWVVEGVLFLLCLAVCVYAQQVMLIISPGFSEQQTYHAYKLLKILIFFIFFLSTCSLLAGALQAIKKFFIPATGQIFLNLFFVGTLLACLRYNFSVTTLAFGIIMSSILLMLMHIVSYYKNGFSFAIPTKKSWANCVTILGKFLPCIISIGATEINIFIDQSFISYLPAGTTSLFYYTSNFVRIPLGVFAVSLATVLLPHFSHVGTYAPRRLGYYVLEATKIIFWVMVPASILLSLFSYKIFYTTLLSDTFTLEHVAHAQQLMTALATGLFFFSLNKILLNAFYALHSTLIPTIITLGATILNTLLNYLVIQKYGVIGVACATSFAGLVQTIVFFIVLHKKYHIPLYLQYAQRFIAKASVQFCALGTLFFIAYQLLSVCIAQLPAPWAHWCMETIAYWFWVAPLMGLMAICAYSTRSWFGLRIHFLD